MSDHDFTELLNAARSKGAVAKMLHPLVLVITTPEYAAQCRGLGGAKLAEGALPLEVVSEAPNLPVS